MMRLILLSGLVVLSACANRLPKHHDVQTSSAELCEHYSNEDGYDPDRAEFIANRAKLYCGQ